MLYTVTMELYDVTNAINSSGNHNVKDCKENYTKCINCITSSYITNEKYSTKLNTDHVVWDVLNCDTYKRVETLRKNKFLR